MESRVEAIAVTLLAVAKSKNKKYCFVSQERIQELLEKYHSFDISNRTLNRDLRWLEDNRFISRVRRIRVGPGGKLIFCSTLYKFEAKIFSWLYLLGNRISRLFSFFRLPKWADHQLTQKRASSEASASSAQTLLIKERNGTILHWDPSNGTLTYPSGVPY